MRIHVQNPPDDPLFVVTPAQWEAAIARNPDIARGHEATIGGTDADFDAAMPEAEALITWVSEVARRFPPRVAAPRLRLVSCTSAGLDRLAPFDMIPAGVALLNNRGTHGAKAGEYAAMALLMLAANYPAHATAQAAGTWRKEYGAVARGRRALVVGLGTLGGAAAEWAARLGMSVVGVSASGRPHPACGRVVTPAGLDAELPQADAVVLACPLTPATRNLLDARRIGLMRPGAGVVNIGRGALLDQDALCDALDAGRLGGAVLDVFVPEPVPPGHRLWRTRNLVVTPHVSADDPATYNDRTLDIFFENLRALRDGRPLPNLVDPARGY
jgi:phosphoglycerate dehydrogenase-like enzyme